MIESLTIVIYILLIILILVAIVCGVKLIFTLNKVDELLEDVTLKVKSLDRVFELVDFATNKMSIITEVIISFINGGIKKIFNSSKKSNKEESIDE